MFTRNRALPPPEVLLELLELELELVEEPVEPLVLLEELELLDDEELDELLFEPPHAPRLVHDASLPGTELVYQFARYNVF